MRKLVKKIIIIFVVVNLVALILLPFANSAVKQASNNEVALISQVSANQDTQSVLCTIFPFLRGIVFAGNLCGGQAGVASALGLGITLVQTLLSLVFVGIIAVAVYTIIRAAIKYIRAEGDDSKVEEAQKSIKRVFIGIGALLVGIVGLAIVIALFGASGGLTPGGNIDTDTLQTCLQNGGTLESCTQNL